ncbi:hypothetical protein SY86_24870 [Erwinia tracheiphila]|uniref:Uncharacterized protein n=1 Tax=Erwinia tracheiphila TaxID=65700 RepID=A0A0M2KAF8_9GAMM|nr:hypothetical protein AV903_00740 [Erwinia tracheiphila]EOS94322.1 hypothetical protein ETR_14351 [Erwinia tracheiphila PSU-1]KKF34228.1 hypothetical protein SY86_24870 [Erwinia tracheiphila]
MLSSTEFLILNANNVLNIIFIGSDICLLKIRCVSAPSGAESLQAVFKALPEAPSMLACPAGDFD